MAEDLRDALEDLQQDMRDHELRHGGEVHASRNQSMAIEAIERLERERADAKPTAPVAADPVRLIGRERREAEHGAYLIDKVATDDLRVRVANSEEHWFIQHAEARLMLLLTKRDTGPLGSPSWAQRVEALLEIRSRVPGAKIAGLHDLAASLEKRFSFELAELLEQSNAVFGDWKADAPKTTQVGWTGGARG